MPNQLLLEGLKAQALGDRSQLAIFDGGTGRWHVPRTGFQIKLAAVRTEERIGGAAWMTWLAAFIDANPAPAYAAWGKDGASGCSALTNADDLLEARRLALEHDGGWVWDCAESRPGRFFSDEDSQRMFAAMLVGLAAAMGIDQPAAARLHDDLVAGGSISLYEREGG